MYAATLLLQLAVIISAARLLGVEDNLGQKNGLAADWAYNAIKQVGNYAEIFDRHLGPKTRLGLTRGPNALWKDGGLNYPFPWD